MTRPRLGFLGVGWIGRHRMAAMLATGAVEAAVIADPADAMAGPALEMAPGATRTADLKAMLGHDLDGVVIATPSAAHAGQAAEALARGAAVFCQKPLGRNLAETAAAIAAARAANRLLAVDMSYRFSAAAQALKAAVASGELGRIHAIDLTFHNAYGPDKPWFRDRALSGGGCLIDLGVHLLDLALWLVGGNARVAAAHLSAAGQPMAMAGGACEDFAAAMLTHDSGALIRLVCSWNLPAGQDAVIAVRLYGTSGGAELYNVDGSFYDLAADRLDGTRRIRLATPPDDWPGRAAAAFAQRLARRSSYDAEVEALLPVARLLDEIYAVASDAYQTRQASLVPRAAIGARGGDDCNGALAEGRDHQH